MTRCLTCGLGERAGEHDWKTGISYKTNPPHKYTPDLRNDNDNPLGFKDKFVANSHKENDITVDKYGAE